MTTFTKDKKVRPHVSLTQKTYAAAVNAANRQDRNISNYIERALKAYLETEEGK